jgi:signal-transduction protein with cAMP-binding, CBS, and nucleotidyltransferase domain
MQECNCRHLPIVEDGKVVDMLSMRDLLRAQISEKDREVTELKDYIKGGPTPKT